MECSFSWDGTLSSGEFHIASEALLEIWKEVNHTLPPWTWVPSSRLPSGTLQNSKGYISLEGVHHMNADKEYHDGGCLDELSDEATLVQSYNQEVHIYDYHILYSASYRVPVLYFRVYRCDGGPVVLEDIEKDLPSVSLKQLKEFKWTFITQEEHPFLNRPWFTLHPCGTSDWMKLLVGGVWPSRDMVIKHYLQSWLSVVGQIVGLRVPLEMLNQSRTTLALNSLNIDK